MNIVDWRKILVLAASLLATTLEAEATQRNCRGEKDNVFLADEIVKVAPAAREDFLERIEGFATAHAMQFSSSKNMNTGAISVFLEPLRPSGIIVEVSENESLGQFHVRVRTCNFVGDWHSVWEMVLQFSQRFQMRS
jgi:hypothetical protein